MTTAVMALYIVAFALFIYGLHLLNHPRTAKRGNAVALFLTMSDAVKTVRQKELQDLEARIREYQQSAQEKIGKKKEELYKPILEKADKAIKEVAKEKGYDYVFDASGGALLYAKEGDNLLPMVKAKLGIK